MADYPELDLGKVTGADGKSAYQYAVDGGYTGTEAEFAALLGELSSAPEEQLIIMNPVSSGSGVNVQLVAKIITDEYGFKNCWIEKFEVYYYMDVPFETSFMFEQYVDPEVFDSISNTRYFSLQWFDGNSAAVKGSYGCIATFAAYGGKLTCSISINVESTSTPVASSGDVAAS